jgi:GAF domain-containing protein
MIAWIKKSFALPVFKDEHKARVAKLLNVMLLFVLGATIIGTAITVPLEPDEAVENLTFGLILVVVMLGLRFLVYRGHTSIVGLLLSSVLWLSFTFLALNGNGVQDPSLSGYFLVIALSILLVGGRFALIFGLISILSTAGILYVEVNDIVTTIVPKPATALDLVTWITTLGLTTALLDFAVRSINASRKHALENELAQIEANRELQAIRASLEQRVEQRTRDLEKQSTQLQTAIKIGRGAALVRNLDELLPQVTDLINEHFGFYHVGVFLLDETTRYAELRAANSIGGQRMINEGYNVAVGEQGIVGHVTGVREARIALDVGEAAVQFEYPHLTLTHSEMVLPLIATGRLLGALDLHSAEPAAFKQDDVAVFQVLADQLAIAIENAYLFAESQAALEAERQAYGEISRQAWAQLMGEETDLGYISDAQRVHPTREHWQPDMIQASQEEQLVQGDGATVAMPIKIREQTAGVVRLRKPKGASEWTTDEIELMENLTRQLGLTLESARHYRDTQQRALRERMTTEITSRIRETLDMDTVLQTAIREIGERLNLAQVQVRMKGQQEE